MTEFDAAEITTQALERGEDPLSSVIGQLVGAASVCWSDMAGTGVFESERAAEMTENVLEWLQTNFVHRSYAGSAPNRLEPGDRLLLAGENIGEQGAKRLQAQLRAFVGEDFDIGVVEGISQVVVASKAWTDWRREKLARDGLTPFEAPLVEDGELAPREVPGGVELPGLGRLMEHFGVEGTPVISHNHELDGESYAHRDDCPACVYIAGQADRLPLEHIHIDG